ncbi:MAG: sulfite exporter TauE/SafE family protein [Limnobacter sp.]|nr:sulfite exporter TauE/SafE family protein [Limnobacter sp.]
MDAHWTVWVLVSLAGFMGGALNAVAGGGSFFTLPALVFAGVPPLAANATGTAALLPGYIASAWRFRKDILMPPGLSLGWVLTIAVGGGVLGAVVLLNTNPDLFDQLVPWLILFATLVFLLGPSLLRFYSANADAPALRPAAGLCVVFLVCAYGGYFNGGLGIVLLAAFRLIGMTHLHGMNGLKNLLSAVLTLAAVSVYGLGGEVMWLPFAVLSVGCVAGGYAGAALAYKINAQWLNIFVVLVGTAMSIAFFLR